MNTLKQAVKSFWNDEEGVTAVEYALIASIMAVAIIAAWGALATAFGTTFATIIAAL